MIPAWKTKTAKRLIVPALMLGAAVLLSSCTSRDHAQRETPAGQGYYAGDVQEFESWPARFNNGGTDFTIFEPQCDSWDGHQITGRCAMAVQGPYDPEARYGVFAFSAITLVDKSTHTVKLVNLQITRTDFPSARNQAQNYVSALTQSFAAYAPRLSLDRLETALAAPPPPKTDRLNNTPPNIIIANRPAILVYIDGPPAWRVVPGTDFQRTINTRMLLLKDSAGRYYLHLYDGYMQSSSLNGPWTTVSQPQPGLAAAEKVATDSGQVDLMNGAPDSAGKAPPTLSSSALPDIFVATTPTELLQFQGQPEYATIPGTALLYANNTSANVFKSLADQRNYILISGRWYSAPSLNGPWQFVPASQLPHDFANIPDSSPKENVKASVPGTQQAAEALIANSIPQGTSVARTSQMPPPQIDGAVQLTPIQGTMLQYVVNCPTPIIEVSPQSWYACQDGVWYDATSANGPWIVATSVPSVIYTIPPDSPLHYVTYVQVYGANPDMVYEGYTPGYMGTEITEDGTVVYGTGYDYSPWVGTVWYGPPITWGWGFDDCWTPWWGWGFGCGFGWAWGWGFEPPFPYWCGFRHHDFDRWHDHNGWHHASPGTWANSSANVYQRQVAGENFVRNRNLNGFGQAYNSRNGWLQAGQHARIQNVGGAAWQRDMAFNNGRFVPRSYGGWNWRNSHTPPGSVPMNHGYSAYPKGGGWNGRNSSPQSPTGSQAGTPGATPHTEGGGGGFRGGGGGGFHGGGGGHGGGGHR